jgi:hypothetical protein
MFSFWKAKPSGTTEFSDFIRNASARKKKQVYTDVLKKATAKQQATMDRHAKAHRG